LAYRYLAYRPRSEEEMRRCLRRGGCGAEVLEEAIARLKEQGLIDDAAFARAWTESRLSSKPKSRRLIQRELRHKAVAEELAERATSGIDDEENAYSLGRRRMRVLEKAGHIEFHRRMTSYLAYRGFPAAMVRRVVAWLWEERQGRGGVDDA
jgi:regulatory protein